MLKRLVAAGIAASLALLSPGSGCYDAWAGIASHARESKTGIQPIRIQMQFSGTLQGIDGYGTGVIAPLQSLEGLELSHSNIMGTLPSLDFPSSPMTAGGFERMGAGFFLQGGASVEYKPAGNFSAKGPGDSRLSYSMTRPAAGGNASSEAASAGGLFSHLMKHAAVPLWIFDADQRVAGWDPSLPAGDHPATVSFVLSRGGRSLRDAFGLKAAPQGASGRITVLAGDRTISGSPASGASRSDGFSLRLSRPEEIPPAAGGGSGASASTGPPSGAGDASSRDSSIVWYVSGLVLMMFGEQIIDPSMQSFLANSQGNSAMLNVMTVSLIGRFFGNLFTAMFAKPHRMKKFLLASMTVRIGAIGSLFAWFLGPEHLGPLRDLLAPFHASPDYFSAVVMVLVGIYSFMRGIHSNSGALEGPIIKTLVGNNKLKLEQIGSIKEWINQIVSIAGPILGAHLAFWVTNVGTIGVMPLAIAIAVLMFAFGVHLPKAKLNGEGKPEAEEETVESPTTDRMIEGLVGLGSRYVPVLFNSLFIRALLVLSSNASRVEAALRKFRGFVGLFVDNPLLRLAASSFILFILPNFLIFQGLASAYGSFAGAELFGTHMITAKLFSLVSLGLLGGGLVHWREGRLLTHLRERSTGDAVRGQNGVLNTSSRSFSALLEGTRRLLLPFIHILDRFVMGLYLRRILDKVENSGTEEAEEAILNESLLFFMRCSAVLMPVAFYAMTATNPMAAFIALPLFFAFDVVAYTKLRTLTNLEAGSHTATVYPIVNAVLVAAAALSMFAMGTVFSNFPAGSAHPFEIFSAALDFLALACVFLIHRFIKRLGLRR